MPIVGWRECDHVVFAWREVNELDAGVLELGNLVEILTAPNRNSPRVEGGQVRAHGRPLDIAVRPSVETKWNHYMPTRNLKRPSVNRVKNRRGYERVAVKADESRGHHPNDIIKFIWYIFSP